MSYFKSICSQRFPCGVGSRGGKVVRQDQLSMELSKSAVVRLGICVSSRTSAVERMDVMGVWTLSIPWVLSNPEGKVLCVDDEASSVYRLRILTVTASILYVNTGPCVGVAVPRPNLHSLHSRCTGWCTSSCCGDCAGRCEMLDCERSGRPRTHNLCRDAFPNRVDISSRSSCG